MKNPLRQCISILLFFFITLLLVPVTSFAENNTSADNSVGSYDDLLTAIKAAPANGTEYIIEITDNINLTAELVVSSGKNITITSDMTKAGAPFMLTQTATTTSGYSGARHFSLTHATLTLENIILSGIGVTSNYNGGVNLVFNSSLVMNDGAIITNCRGGTVGGGVRAANSTLTMNGGKISGNAASSNGGGVYSENGTITMSKGALNGNTAILGGGLYMGFSSFTMSGGTISNNKAVSDTADTAGGGVYNIYGTLTITAGEISGNEAISPAAGASSHGGGVTVLGSHFNIGVSGGSNDSVLIMNNTADYMGGGVHVFSSVMTMHCGTVSGNKALSGDESTYGGGLEIYGGSSFTMKNGIISNNTANDFSGGVEVYDNSKFTMDGGSITNNTAPRGGGISVGYRSATFNMNGGIISGNTAIDTGGGLNVYSDGVMTVTLGMISGNSAPYGGGIFTDDTGTVNVDNCTIADNAATASDGGGGGIYTADVTYANLTTGNSTVFDSNSAATAYTPAGDLDAEYLNIRYAAVTDTFAHPLNNYDINTTFNLLLECHITFDSQGGSAVPDQFKNFGETVDRPTDPTKTDYTFYGWWTKDENGEWDYKWDFDTVLVLETHGTELVLYARWDEPTITVSGTVSGLPDNSGIMIVYSGDGGITTNATVTDDSGNYSFTIAYGSNVVITPAALSEYSVNPNNITLENLSEDSANNDFTYSHNTVIYNSNGGQGPEKVSTDHTVLDSTDTNLGFTKDNYTFIGWNTQADGNGITYNSGDILASLAVDKTVTLYAMWQKYATPQTGDSSDLFFWIATALSALLIIVSQGMDSRKSSLKRNK